MCFFLYVTELAGLPVTDALSAHLANQAMRQAALRGRLRPPYVSAAAAVAATPGLATLRPITATAAGLQYANVA